MAIDTIGTNAIANDAVTAAKIPAGAVDADITAIPDGSVTTAKIANDAVTTAKLYAENLGRRNLLLNGSMVLNQRVVSNLNATGFICDRWQLTKQNFDNLVLDCETQTSVSPTDEGFKSAIKVEVTTAETALASDELLYVRQKMEAQNLQHLKYGTSNAESLTLSFWVRSSLVGKYSVMFYQDDDTRSNLQSYTINTADTWEYKTITIAGDTTGVIDNNVHTGLQVFFTLAAGSDYTGTPHTGWGAYSATDDFAHSDMVDFSAQTGTWYLTGVQLETGTSATPFEHISFHENQRMCMRYYQKSYNVETAPGTSTQIGAIYQRHEAGANVSNRCVPMVLPVNMSKSPTCTTYSINGQSGSVSDCQTGYTQQSSVTGYFNGTDGSAALSKITLGAGRDDIIGFHYTLEAELA